ncbi:MAG: recombinase family protein, partial [Candidatus Thiodiazotropha endolucinida]
VYGYTRVSTTKQGTEGVSLQEQKAAIERYAQAQNLTIIDWFTEQQTAAKRGRPVFSRMLRQLRAGKADGVVIHKIDRSARNLKDWADLGELIDSGIKVHFAHETLDLHSRGGRLSADIQAVIAADYIRNLREETRKGFYGRLKQGLYPLPAPIGYLDRGKGQPKEIDPDKAPLVKQVFLLYATGKYSLAALVDEAKRLGLFSRTGGAISKNGLSVMLNNSFYMGMIHLKSTGELFSGIHEPIISKSLFDQVQDVLSGKVCQRTTKHMHQYRRMIRCAYCNSSLIGELQKGRVYYRCHTKHCPSKTLREDYIKGVIKYKIKQLRLTGSVIEGLEHKIDELRQNSANHTEGLKQNLQLRRDRLNQRIDRVTDAYIDQVIDKKIYERRKNAVLLELKDVEETLQQIEHGELDYSTQMTEIVERLKSLILGYALAEPEERREMLQWFMSNCVASDKKLDIELQTPYEQIKNRSTVLNCAPFRDGPRTCTGKHAPGAYSAPFREEFRTYTGQVADVNGVYNILYQHCEEGKKKSEELDNKM